jgi:hypothetical protein
VKTLFGCVALALAALAGAPVGAQQAPREGAQARPGEARRDEAFKLVDAYVVSNIQESLGLSDEQFVKVLPLVRKLQGDRRDYLVSRSRLLREMRRQLRSGTASEGQVLEQLRELKGLETDGPARVKKSADTLDAVLSPLQQAKFRLLELEVEQRMRELMGRPRAGAPGREVQQQ